LGRPHLSIRVSPPSAPFPGNSNNSLTHHHHLACACACSRPPVRRDAASLKSFFARTSARESQLSWFRCTTTLPVGNACLPARQTCQLQMHPTLTSAANHISRKRRHSLLILQHSNQSAAGNTPHRRFPQGRRSFRTTKICAAFCAALARTQARPASGPAPPGGTATQAHNQGVSRTTTMDRRHLPPLLQPQLVLIGAKCVDDLPSFR
jgi:hypothetical protein